jgi:hypothetical protein
MVYSIKTLPNIALQHIFGLFIDRGMNRFYCIMCASYRPKAVGYSVRNKLPTQVQGLAKLEPALPYRALWVFH